MAQQKKRKNQKNQKVRKIKRYRKPLNLNIGMMIFLAVFVYVVICVVGYFRTSQIKGYEVQEGSLSTTNIFRGIAVREETVVSTQSAGYVNYYAREGERVANGDLVYTVDQAGRLKEYIENASLGENSLSNQELAEFRSEIVNFMHGFSPGQFDAVYDFKYSVKGTVLKLANSKMMKDINDINGSSDLTDLVDFCRAPETGIVAYWTDGYEGLTADMVTADILEAKEYEKKQLISTELVETGQPAYKLSTNEKWSLVIQVDEEKAAQLEEEEYVKVRFMKNQYESWGQVKTLHNGDGNTFVELAFTNSMVTFVSDRFLDVELILNDEVGLKIPNSSIVEREFFLVPEAYVTQGGSNGKSGVIRQCVLEDGALSSEFVETELYYFDETEREYYLDTTALEIGNILFLPDSQETYTVSRKATLIGVYNMNKGYADFRQINILYQNEEYAIVQSNTRYGLNVYDYIVLNAESVEDEQFLLKK